MTITLQQAWMQAAQSLQAANIARPYQEAQYLLCAHLAPDEPKDMSYLYLHAHAVLPDATLFHHRVQQRALHQPLSRLIGRRAFWRDHFIISSAVLDPRPDSEALIQAALALYSNREQVRRVLDLGCGSGCLGLSLLREFPHAHLLGCDISTDALDIARLNGEKLDLSTRVTWQQSDWWDSITPIDVPFDLIICNPPYLEYEAELPPEVREYDPPLALYADDHGLAAYRLIMAKLEHYLCPSGYAVVESSPWQTLPIAALAMQHQLCCFSPLGHHQQTICPPKQLGLCALARSS